MGSISEYEPLNDAVKLQVAKNRATVTQGYECKPLRMFVIERKNTFAMIKRLRDCYGVSNISTLVQLQKSKSA